MNVSGIELNVTADDLDDYEVTECLSTMMDEEAANNEKMVAISRLFRLVFKDDWSRIKKELRNQNGGRLTNGTVMGFFTELTAELNAKNT